MPLARLLLLSTLFAVLSFGPRSARAENQLYRGLAFKQRDDGGHLTYRNFPALQLVTFSGDLESVTGGPLVQRLSQSLIQGKPVTLVISGASGGKIDGYHRFAAVLRSACPNGACQITTYVRDLCASACVDLFMKSDLRISSKHAVFGFHRESFTFGPLKFVESHRSFFENYVRLGVTPDGMQAITEQLVPVLRDCLWVQADDAIRFGVVHRFEISDDAIYKFGAYLPSDFLNHVAPRPSAKFLTTR